LKKGKIIKNHKFLLIIILFSSLLMFLNLGDRYFWSDEAYASLWAKSILENGIPKADLGENLLATDLFGEPGCQTRCYNEDYVFIFNPWLEDYSIAFSFLIFGINTFAARFPFALFGILTLIALYLFAFKLTNNKKIANLSIFLLSLYIPLYLYSRNARYYSLTMLLALIVLLSYLYFLDNRRYSAIIFAVSNILLFYTHYIPFFATFAALSAHFIIFKFKKKKFKKLICCSAIIFAFTFPWFIYSGVTSTSDFSFSKLLFGSFYLFAYFLLYLFPAIFLFFIPKLLSKKENYLILLMVLFGILICTLGPIGLPSPRYIVFLFPITLILIAQVFLLIKKYNKYLFFILILFLLFTNYLFVLPFKPFEKPLLNKTEKDSDSYLFIKDNLQIRYLIFDYLYEITHPYESPNAKIVNYLIKNSYKDEVYLTNSQGNVIMFYTDMVEYRGPFNKTPDWIIPRKSRALWGNIIPYDFVLSKINESYELIIINSTEYIYTIDNPNPRTHRFKENIELKTSDIYPQETYPIKIYRLKKT